MVWLYHTADRLPRWRVPRGWIVIALALSAWGAVLVVGWGLFEIFQFVVSKVS